MILLFILFYALAVLAGIQQANKRRINIGLAIVLCLIFPIIGLFIVSTRPKKTAGCHWCGNNYNEAIYCGVCHKNKNGDLRPGAEEKDFSDRHLVE